MYQRIKKYTFPKYKFHSFVPNPVSEEEIRRRSLDKVGQTLRLVQMRYD